MAKFILLLVTLSLLNHMVDIDFVRSNKPKSVETVQIDDVDCLLELILEKILDDDNLFAESENEQGSAGEKPCEANYQIPMPVQQTGTSITFLFAENGKVLKPEAYKRISKGYGNTITPPPDTAQANV